MQRVDGSTSASAGRRSVVARARCRGQLPYFARLPSFFVLFVAFGSSVVGGNDPLRSLVAAVVAVLWLLWTLRPAVLVTLTSVELRGLWTTRSIPIGEVEEFGLVRSQMPLHRWARSVTLVLHRRDGVTPCTWVEWTDMISPLLTAGTRPVTVRQQRVLDRLNGALDQAAAI